ncbi:MAG TPA: hypothetical protein VNI57_08040 [Candidatus Saccharimonadales bacterium]|nr:hypothetical protein [Candidatus Saccharimonadales bacterium]
MSRGRVYPLIAIALATISFACGPSGEPAATADESSAAAAQPAAAPAPVVLDAPKPGTAPANPYSPEQIARGEMLVTFGSCNDCHTPFAYNAELSAPVPDMRRMLSGHPEGAPGPGGKVGPADMGLLGPTGTAIAFTFGTVYAINLTPDVDTGTGSWTEEMWLNIWKTGSHLGGGARPIFPPMPWYSVASLSKEDQIAIFAYLRSIPPIHNGVPTFNPPPPVEQVFTNLNAAILKGVEARKAAAKPAS